MVCVFIMQQCIRCAIPLIIFMLSSFISQESLFVWHFGSFLEVVALSFGVLLFLQRWPMLIRRKIWELTSPLPFLWNHAHSLSDTILITSYRLRYTRVRNLFKFRRSASDTYMCNCWSSIWFLDVMVIVSLKWC